MTHFQENRTLAHTKLEAFKNKDYRAINLYASLWWRIRTHFPDLGRLRQVVSQAWHKRCFKDTVGWNFADVQAQKKR